jgi:hypothetical protein
MTLEERSNLVLAFAKVLYVNGQDTDLTMAAAERLGRALGLRVRIMPGWGELQLRSEGNDPKLMCQIEASPAGINMTRGFGNAGNRGDRGSGGAICSGWVAGCCKWRAARRRHRS